MKKSLLRVVLVVMTLAVLTLSVQANQVNKELMPSSADQVAVQTVVDKCRVDLEQQLVNSVPSLSILVRTPKEEIFASSASGDIQAMTRDTYFRFASNTKLFTATAVLKMHQDGWLDIKARIVDNIPGTNIAYVPDNADWNIPYKSQITIEQLLQHSAGIYDIDNMTVPSLGSSYTDYQLQRDMKHQFTVDEFAAHLTKDQLSFFPPGTGYHYSNTGYAILSKIISRVYSARAKSNKSYADYLNVYVVGTGAKVPLSSIHFPMLATDDTMPQPYYAGTIRDKAGETRYASFNMSGQAGEGNGYGTMSDLGRFVRTLMRGENVLSSKTVKLMQTDATKYQPNYALGCLHMEKIGYGHNGARIGNLSLMMYDSTEDVSVIVYLPLFDLTKGMDTMLLCLNTLNNTAVSVKAALGCSAAPLAK